jgi:hypothetical protein
VFFSPNSLEHIPRVFEDIDMFERQSNAYQNQIQKHSQATRNTDTRANPPKYKITHLFAPLNDGC